MIRLRELREERGWTMREASRFLKKSYTTYVNHEKEYREPNSEDLVAYAKAYGVSVDYLVGRTEIRTPARDEDYEANIALEILDILDKLTEENLLIIKEHALFLLDRQKDAPSSTSKVG